MEKIDIKAHEVREIRYYANESRNDFAKRFGVSGRTIENWEQGRCRPPQPAVIMLARVAVEVKGRTMKDWAKILADHGL